MKVSENSLKSPMESSSCQSLRFHFGSCYTSRVRHLDHLQYLVYIFLEANITLNARGYRNPFEVCILAVLQSQTHWKKLIEFSSKGHLGSDFISG